MGCVVFFYFFLSFCFEINCCKVLNSAASLLWFAFIFKGNSWFGVFIFVVLEMEPRLWCKCSTTEYLSSLDSFLKIPLIMQLVNWWTWFIWEIISHIMRWWNWIICFSTTLIFLNLVYLKGVQNYKVLPTGRQQVDSFEQCLAPFQSGTGLWRSSWKSALVQQLTQELPPEAMGHFWIELVSCIQNMLYA